MQPASPDTQSRTVTCAALKRPVRPGKSVGVAGSGVMVERATARDQQSGARPRPARRDGAPDGAEAAAPARLTVASPARLAPAAAG